MPMSPPASQVTTTTSPNTTDRPMYYTTHAFGFCYTPTAIPSFTLTSPTQPFASGHLEIAPPTHSQVIEMKDAIQLVNSRHPFLDLAESDNEPDTDARTPLAGPSRPKYASRAVIYLHSYLRGARLPELFRASATSPYADVLFPLGDPAKRNLLDIIPNRKRKISQFRKFSQEMFIKATKLCEFQNFRDVAVIAWLAG